MKRKLVALGAAYQAYASELRRLGRIDPEERLAQCRAGSTTIARFSREYVSKSMAFSWTRRERERLLRAGAERRHARDLTVH